MTAHDRRRTGPWKDVEQSQWSDWRWQLRQRLTTADDLSRVFLRSVFRFYQERGRALGLAAGQTGSVTVVQRFGSALNLNLNVHLHCLVLDGLFVKTDADEAPSFHSIPAPTTEPVQAVLVYATNRMERWLRRQGLDLDEEEIADEDAFAALASASVAGRVALGVRERCIVSDRQKLRNGFYTRKTGDISQAIIAAWT